MKTESATEPPSASNQPLLQEKRAAKSFQLSTLGDEYYMSAAANSA